MRQFGGSAAQPVSIGKRVIARLINAAVGGLTYLVFLLPMLSDLQNPAATLDSMEGYAAISMVMGVVFAIVMVALILTRSTTLGHLGVKVTYLKAATGEGAKGLLFLRYLVSGVFEGATFGLGAISYFFTYRDGQHWLDRAFGTVGVQRESVRMIAVPSGPPAAYQQRGTVSMGGSAGATPASAAQPFGAAPGFPTRPPSSRVQPPAASSPPPRVATPPQNFGPPPASSSFVSERSAKPTPVAPPMPLAVLGGSIPSGTPGPVAPYSSPPAGLEDSDSTVLDLPPVRTPVPAIILDDGTRIVLDTPVVLGRNPTAPAAYPSARCVPVVDPSRRMSKTHLVLLAVDGDVQVLDSGATNGIHFEMDGYTTKLSADEPHRLGTDARLHFGGRSLKVGE